MYHDKPQESLIGAGTRAFSQDLFLQEAEDRVVVAARNVHERKTLVPWMGRAIFVPEGTAAKTMRIPDGQAPEGITRSGPNYGVVFPGKSSEVRYAFIANWNVDGGITSWDQYTGKIDRLQQELSSPVLELP